MDLVISTKLSGGGRGARDSINSVGLSRKHLVEGMRASLDRLGLEYVDLVFSHSPDPRTPMVEVGRGGRAQRAPCRPEAATLEAPSAARAL